MIDQLAMTGIGLLIFITPVAVIIYSAYFLWDNRRRIHRMLFGSVSSRIIKEYVRENWDKYSDAEMAAKTGASINVVNHTRRGLGLRRTAANAKKLQKKAIAKLKK